MILQVKGIVEKKLVCADGHSILEALLKAGVYISAPCGGKGRCGKCRVRLLAGQCPPGAEDYAHFTKEELAEGWRLACCAYPQEDCTVLLTQPDEEQFDVLTEIGGDAVSGGNESAFGAGLQAKSGDAKKTGQIKDGSVALNRYFFAVDIGTTTLAISLVSAADGQTIDTYTGVNHQRAFGADVISRIKAYDEGHGGEMTASIKKDLITGMTALLIKTGVDVSGVERVVIAGNTTMGHLLLGYDCHGLGQMPFTPVNIGTVTMPFGELFGADALLDCPVTVMPGFSAYVGGDIVSGLLCTGMYREDAPSLLIDLGTNGEMAIGCREKLLVTSTAAGPAFEGGNLSCGVGSVRGAICEVRIENDAPQVRTIGNEAPVGICGTGAIETAAELLRTELLEDSGLLDEDYFDDGYVLAQMPDGEDIAVTQKDIRELQLAKAAVRAGLETLLLRYGIGYDELAHVYVAGGFGVHLEPKMAAAIGLLPKELLDKVEAVGNTSLGGAIRYGTDTDADAVCREMIARAQEVDLSMDKDFQEFYMDAMIFE